VKDYNSAVNLIVEADVLTRGLIVGNYTDEDEDGPGPSQVGPSINLTDEERRRVKDGECYAVRGAE